MHNVHENIYNVLSAMERSEEGESDPEVELVEMEGGITDSELAANVTGKILKASSENISVIDLEKEDKINEELQPDSLVEPKTVAQGDLETTVDDLEMIFGVGASAAQIVIEQSRNTSTPLSSQPRGRTRLRESGRSSGSSPSPVRPRLGSSIDPNDPGGGDTVSSGEGGVIDLKGGMENDPNDPGGGLMGRQGEGSALNDEEGGIDSVDDRKEDITSREDGTDQKDRS